MSKSRTVVVGRRTYSVTAKALDQNRRRWEVVFEDVTPGTDEKPKYSVFVNSGIGVSETEACDRAVKTFALPKSKLAPPDALGE